MDLSKELDEFNLEVAKYRVKVGMSEDLVQLYADMEQLASRIRLAQGEWNSAELKCEKIKTDLVRIKEFFNQVISLNQHLIR